jgi:hypothetical protein
MKDNKLALTVLIVGLIGFLYPLSSFLMDLKDWQVIDQPASVGQLVRCAVFALAAMAGAAGINVKTLLPSLFTVEKKEVEKV